MMSDGIYIYWGADGLKGWEEEYRGGKCVRVTSITKEEHESRNSST